MRDTRNRYDPVYGQAFSAACRENRGGDAAFLMALRDARDDDTARLVYADWLDDRDDPRGEYLRLELRLVGMKPWEPEYPGAVRRLAELRGALPPGTRWPDAAGKTYDVVLRSCAPGLVGHVVNVLVWLEQQDRMRRRRRNRHLPPDPAPFRRAVATAPVVLMRRLLRSHAETAVHCLRIGQDRRGNPVEFREVVVETRITPADYAVALRTPRRVSTRDEAIAVIEAEATRLGMTLEEFVRPENRNNRTLSVALRYFRNHETRPSGIGQGVMSLGGVLWSAPDGHGACASAGE